MYKKCVIAVLCISIAANLTHWKVLCFGADGHIEFESVFHERCGETDNSSAPIKNVFSSQAGHEMCNHCGPCIDVPISIGLAKVSRTQEQLKQYFLFETTYIFIDTDEFNFSVSNLASNTFTDTSYFYPLRTVVLLV